MGVMADLSAPEGFRFVDDAGVAVVARRAEETIALGPIDEG